MFIDEVIKKFPDIPRPDAVFNVQNVADYVYSNTHTYKGHIQECFSYRIPFNPVWFEFMMGATYREGNVEEMIDKENRAIFGMLMSTTENGFFRLAVFIKINHFDDEVEYMGELALSLDEKFTATKIPEDKDAYPVWASKSYMNFFNRIKSIDPDFSVDITFGGFPVVTSALNFLHCKNVMSHEHHIPKKLIKANIKRGKPRPYFEKYYTLEIEPMKKILNTEGQAQTVGLKKAFHICRGHFKNYDANPLFGKIKGTFWVPAHVKGDVKKGVIKKDYKIKI